MIEEVVDNLIDVVEILTKYINDLEERVRRLEKKAKG